MKYSKDIFTKKIKPTFKTEDVKNSFTVFSSKVAAALFGFASNILVVRCLEPSEYGILSTAVAIIVTVGGLADFGLKVTFIRLGSGYLAAEAPQIGVLFRQILSFKTSVGLLTGVLGCLSAPSLAILLFQSHQFIPAIQWAFAGLIGYVLWQYLIDIFELHQRFRNSAIATTLFSLTRLCVVAVMIVTQTMNLNYMLVLTASIYYGATLIAVMLLTREPFFAKMFTAGKYLEKAERIEVFKEILKFSKWVAVTTICFMIFRRLDIFMIGHYMQPKDVGLYAAALNLTQPLSLLIGSLMSVYLPSVSRINSYREYVSYIKRTLLVSGTLSIAFSPAIFLTHPLMVFVYGNKYEEAAMAMQILLGAFLISLFFNPITIIAFSGNAPELLAFIDILKLVLCLSVNLWLIPILGITGAAVATFATNLMGGLLAATVIYRRILVPLRVSQDI